MGTLIINGVDGTTMIVPGRSRDATYDPVSDILVWAATARNTCRVPRITLDLTETTDEDLTDFINTWKDAVEDSPTTVVGASTDTTVDAETTGSVWGELFCAEVEYEEDRLPVGELSAFLGTPIFEDSQQPDGPRVAREADTRFD